MELLAAAMKEFGTNTNLDDEFNVELKIIEDTKSIPVILTDSNGTILESHNLDSIKSLNPRYLEKQLQIMQTENDPIEISYKNTQKQYIYYRNSDLLYKLTYYPLALLLILGLFLLIVYMMFQSGKIAEQNKLWTGMAKETAHQIGTPLSSLLGWVTILRSEQINEMYVNEIEKDVDRLSVIANRFSKIGSLPELQHSNITKITHTVFKYIESRSSKKITFVFESENEKLKSSINEELFGWVIENLLKNAIDAVQGKGKISVFITEKSKGVSIRVSILVKEYQSPNSKVFSILALLQKNEDGV
ncbi:sensor histidine kinase [Tenacibaculum sp. SG-28]|uniref:sensor histidine kinase n=1 Tax=Tenacibaculum sp. SG-28 TaxID=754426 RepID=UPI00351872DF